MSRVRDSLRTSQKAIGGLLQDGINKTPNLHTYEVGIPKVREQYRCVHGNRVETKRCTHGRQRTALLRFGAEYLQGPSVLKIQLWGGATGGVKTLGGEDGSHRNHIFEGDILFLASLFSLFPGHHEVSSFVPPFGQNNGQNDHGPLKLSQN